MTHEDIKHGEATILATTVTIDGERRKCWALPGGGKTVDREFAQRVAVRINKIIISS